MNRHLKALRDTLICITFMAVGLAVVLGVFKVLFELANIYGPGPVFSIAAGIAAFSALYAACYADG